MTARTFLRSPVGLVVLVAAATAVCALVSPGFRVQATLSASREPARYLALSFADPAAVRSCSHTARDIQFVVANHLGRAAELDYQVAVIARDGTRSARDGQVDVADGESKRATSATDLPPRQAFDLTVRLHGRAESLSLHCGAAS